MTRTCQQFGYASLCSILLAIFLAGCNSGGSGAPPAPPPFRPQTVTVALGESGDSITLRTTQAGGYTRNNRPFASGDTVTAENDNVYRLTLASGRWSAAFVPPDPVEVRLGTSGDRVRLVQTEDPAAFTRDGQPFASGSTVTADNENVYRLTLASGSWSAEFVPQETRVALGNLGGSITLMTTEAGGYERNNQRFTGGRVRGDNGRYYEVTLGVNGWVARFEPQSQTVLLGNSGERRVVTEAEDGRFLVDGVPLGNDGVVVARTNSYRYVLTRLPNGRWTARFVGADPVRVWLGDSRSSVLLVLGEDGEYRMGNQIVRKDGYVHPVSSDRQYRLTFRNGQWTATFIPVTVRLPVAETGGVVPVLRLENGSHTYDGERVTAGRRVTLAGAEYEFTGSDSGGWTAVFRLGRFRVPLGTSGEYIELTKLRDGTFQRDGRRFRSGTTVTADNGDRYRLVYSTSAGWTSTYRPPLDLSTGTGSGSGSSSSSSLDSLEERVSQGPAPTFKKADGTRDNDEGVTLVVKTSADASAREAEYAIRDLVGRGIVTRTVTFVERARETIADLRRGLSRRRALYAAGDLPLDRDVKSTYWPQLQRALKEILDTDSRVNSYIGASPPGGRLIEGDEIDDVLEVFDDVLDALRSRSAFDDEIFDPHLDALTDPNASQSASEAFEAPFAKMRFGSTRNTRFAVSAIQDSSGGSAAVPTSWTLGSFAYSPLESPRRSQLSTGGTALFEGKTVAAHAIAAGSRETPEFYTGDISVRIRFGSGRVTGDITNLKDDQGRFWRYGSETAESIRLPEATLDANGVGFSVEDMPSTVRFVTSQPLATFQGRVVGDDDDETDAVIGTWYVQGPSNQPRLDGAFGAEYKSTASRDLPSLEASPRGSRALTAFSFPWQHGPTAPQPNSAGNIVLGCCSGNIRAADLYGDSDGEWRRDSAGSISDYRYLVEYRYTNYTRFGAWAHQNLDSLSSRTPTDQAAQGLFAYSPLSATVFAASGDRAYPRSLTGSYVGKTILYDVTGTWSDLRYSYEGDLTLTVNWNDARSNASIQSEIRNPRSNQNNAKFMVGGQPVERLRFSGTTSFASDSSFTLTSDSSPGSFVVWYEDGGLGADRRFGDLSGTFLGQSSDGPAAVIGSWNLTTDAARSDVIARGAYGADLR